MTQKTKPRFICWRFDLPVGKDRPAYVEKPPEQDKPIWTYTDRRPAARLLTTRQMLEFRDDTRHEGGEAFCQDAYGGPMFSAAKRRRIARANKVRGYR